MKRNIIILLVSIFAFASCQERGLELFSSKPYITFEGRVSDTTVFSFFFHEEDVVKHPFVVKLTGKQFETDQKFKLGYVEKTTTLDKSLFEIEEYYTFGAGQLKDTIYVTLKNGDVLKTKEFSLELELQGWEDDVYSSSAIFQRAYMKVSDKSARPAWWGTDYYDYDLGAYPDDVYWDYLGEYSDKKFQLFMQVTGVSDLSEYILVPNQNWEPVRRYSLQFKHYLVNEAKAGRPVYEENGDLMEVPVNG